ncbi:hypothetical protein IVB06_13690 [Bradyrhizobium sp. 171]|uniref:hypothetical protein n=1 Tax=unclassified Bradyrhizobium TaxID=2631580 RepID=UPI001FF817D5|nr:MULTISPECIES: hypothetical protein [unclassified Bradyrhizobium]MCK1487748.1 hypothetical protein [Bradyrhizobium sp. 193]MCK1536169.1 hypothetical protein [Bradyrhizobium sp. 176]MCK1557373.1 hypothetical protein [Bradyrhizobium sp. 171]
MNIGFNRSASELSFDGANIWAHPSNDFDANLEVHRGDFEAPFPWTFATFPLGSVGLIQALPGRYKSVRKLATNKPPIMVIAIGRLAN